MARCRTAKRIPRQSYGIRELTKPGGSICERMSVSTFDHTTGSDSIAMSQPAGELHFVLRRIAMAYKAANEADQMAMASGAGDKSPSIRGAGQPGTAKIAENRRTAEGHLRTTIL